MTEGGRRCQAPARLRRTTITCFIPHDSSLRDATRPPQIAGDKKPDGITNKRFSKTGRSRTNRVGTIRRHCAANTKVVPNVTEVRYAEHLPKHERVLAQNQSERRHCNDLKQRLNSSGCEYVDWRAGERQTFFFICQFCQQLQTPTGPTGTATCPGRSLKASPSSPDTNYGRLGSVPLRAIMCTFPSRRHTRRTVVNSLQTSRSPSCLVSTTFAFKWPESGMSGILAHSSGSRLCMDEIHISRRSVELRCMSDDRG